MIFPCRSIESGCQFQRRINNGQVSVDIEENGYNGEMVSPKMHILQVYGDEILKEDECYARVRSFSRRGCIQLDEALT